MVTEEAVYEALKRVVDPELGINIVDLGLVYDVRTDRDENSRKTDVEVEMTLTSAGCPLAGVIDRMVREEVGKISGVGEVDLEMVWDPPWSTELMSESAKAELNID